MNLGYLIRQTPIVVKNLVLINAILLLAKYALATQGVSLDDLFGLFYFDSLHYQPWQLVTHFFMHADFSHLFFNMFGLWMFGSQLERMWGAKRFINFYVITAFGAMFLYMLVKYIEVQALIPQLEPGAIETILNEGRGILKGFQNYTNPAWAEYNLLVNGNAVGASGAIFGILAAFAYYWPNTELFLIFIPIPIKAKYFVIIYAAVELFLGLSGFQTGVAHFAHLGGALFGFLMVKYWNKTNRNSLY